MSLGEGPLDRFGRRFHYLRLSVTDVCNFRCAYCLPDGYQKCKGAPAPLDLAEIKNLVSTFARIGMRKVRITGGEPTVRKDLLEILRAVAETPGVRKLALSTNGWNLKKNALAWRQAGVTAINISVDSLTPATFAAITGMDRLHEILSGIDAALTLDFTAIKLNAVLLKDWNDREISTFLEFIRSRPLTVRFIELMQTGESGSFFPTRHLSATRLREELESSGWRPVPRALDAGPALELSHPEYLGRIGLIAPYSKDFCLSCNRLRVTSTGDLRLCLFAQGQVPLRPLLQSPDQSDELIGKITELLDQKTISHLLASGNPGSTRRLAEMGG